jgi:hypothetical protein
MKTFIIPSLAVACLIGIAGCATTETGTASRDSAATSYPLDDQPQTAIAGEGSLMPGAYGSRPLPTGQFTGRERTNDQIGQHPTLPPAADARELARSEEGLATGAGTLGQSGIFPDKPVSSETLIESSFPPVTQAEQPAAPPRQSQLPMEGVGSAPPSSEGANASTNGVQNSRPE